MWHAGILVRALATAQRHTCSAHMLGKIAVRPQPSDSGTRSWRNGAHAEPHLRPGGSSFVALLSSCSGRCYVAGASPAGNFESLRWSARAPNCRSSPNSS